MRIGTPGTIDNDEQAFIVGIYKDYYGFVKRTVIKITGAHSDLDDLVNDCFLKLIEKTPTLRSLSGEQLVAYIKYTARSVAINYAKHQNVVSKYVDDAAETGLADCGADTSGEPGERLIQEHELEQLTKASRSCRKKTKNILYFKYLLDMTDEQISKVYSISIDSVRSYLSRARRDAKKLISEVKNYGN
jgi:RNA polymerase sigma-70 factor (ECF subfamily)